ncbi:putative ripening-related protein 7 [Rutidosis leptorrhynchoides]|uniref:putative ripening-related protein 7 n=1 Tax=Rutidosis leptorrhynchoides TaxID=125765 RepID=UPI003A99758A
MKQPAIRVIILLFIFLSLFIFSINVNSTTLKATLTLNGFEKGESGGGPAECDGKYHSDDDPIVALSTRWYNHGQRCFKYININYQDKSVRAMVVDECDSTRGCKDDIVDASRAVWNALQVPKSQYGETGVTWSDA